MPKQIVIAEQHRLAAVFSEDQIQELIVATGAHQVSDVYLGIVENVIPGIDAAFVNIGDSERNGFIHVSDLGPLKLRRNSSSITELLVPQQKVLVQVMKEPTGNKGPRLTGNITLPGRYLVLLPYNKGVNLSRRIRNENERNRLRALAILIKPAGMGLVVRTEAEDMPEDAIIEDLEALQRQWESTLQEAESTRPPALLNRDEDFIQRVLRDVYSADVNRIVVDSQTGMKRVKQHIVAWNGGKAPQGVLIDHHRDRMPILDYFRINAAIRESLNPRVDLPSGGYIIIERTEALTVIDVNSGSFTRSATARETVLWTNCEAATEIARQLRLRNIAGVIVVDFIDMDSRRDQLQLLEHFNKALQADKAKPQIAQLTELGLIELTRKRQGKNIYELFGQPCPTCGGLGHLAHLPEHADGEPVERLPALGLRESRGNGTTRTSEAAESAFQELSLPHPNYQDVSGANRRRRRRRDDDNKPVGGATGRMPVPASDTPDTDTSSSDDSGRGSRSRRRRGGRSNGKPELAATPEPTPTPAVSETKDTPPPPEERRSRSRRNGDKDGGEPPEVVAVEMTPEEQDVYAWMGVSPLVLTEQEIKNPRSAIISVVLPGEAPMTNGPLAALMAPPDEDTPATPEPAAASPKASPVPAAATMTVPAADADLATSTDDTASSDEDDTTTKRTRRRRRRSSATDE